MKKFNFKAVEKKWQSRWEKEKAFEVKENPKKKKYYVLEMYPYPSGEGLHIGHAFNYTIGDIYARFKRMQGFNVLYPMGYDSFGLPAENAAIKNKSHPKKFTEDAIKNYIKQQKNLGLSYDWTRKVECHKPEFYKWDQWIFLQMFKKGLAYKKKAPVNWCRKCNTVLANEQVKNGKCYLHENIEVEIKHLEQWFLKITKYANELYEDIEKLKDWPEDIKAMQRNWIGKSYGYDVGFEIVSNKKINCVIVHGCPSRNEKSMNEKTRTYDKHWMPWIKKKLFERGINCDVPLMPEPWEPKYGKWKKEFEKNDINENTILVGHSCGGGFLVRWLGETGKKIKKLILVAPAIMHSGNYNPLRNMLNYEINKNIRNNINEIIIFSSKDDTKGILESVEIFKENLRAKVLEFEDKGHFTIGDMKTEEFPELLKEITLGEKWTIFTTRPDTLFGVTFTVVSCQHPRLMELVTEKQKPEVEKFLKKIKSTSEKELEELEKEGAFTGSYAINPATCEKVPIYAGNFVVADYGCGMVMAVPAHDQRDFEFAKKYKLPIRPVIIKKHEESFSYVMGVSEKDIINIGVKIIEKTKDGFFKIKIPFNKLDNYKEFIRKNLEPGFWNEFSTPNGFYFIFKHKNGSLEEFELNEKTNDIIDKYGMTFNNEKPKDIPENVYDWLADNDFYSELLIHTSEGILVNSGEFNGLPSEEAIEKIGNKFGKKTINFKLRDWLISRQRFWGTPIPIIYCDKCGTVPVPEKDLPIKLPDNIKFTSERNPLIGNEKFVNAKCPKCKGKAKRETDTMDTFVNSSWYFLRYCDAKSEREIFDKKKVKYWMPIDTYIGGREHATGHLIYFRFYTKFLRDLGLLNFDEPAVKLFNQGMVHGENGEKMSKSKGNVVLPETVSEKFGIDAARLFLVSLGGLDKNRDWNDKGAEGSLRFIEKVVDYFGKIKKGKSSEKVEHKVNKAIREITEEIENMKYNLAVIKLRSLFESFDKEISKKALESFIKLLSPFCPHIAEELWEKVGNKNLVSLESWPKHDNKKIKEKFDKADEVIEKTVSDILNILKIVKGKKVYVYTLPNEIEFYDSEEIKNRVGKEIKIFAVNDKDKYDPQGKARKAKPGKPGVFVE